MTEARPVEKVCVWLWCHGEDGRSDPPHGGFGEWKQVSTASPDLPARLAQSGRHTALSERCSLELDFCQVIHRDQNCPRVQSVRVYGVRHPRFSGSGVWSGLDAPLTLRRPPLSGSIGHHTTRSLIRISPCLLGLQVQKFLWLGAPANVPLLRPCLLPLNYSG
ncbi:hypothetical protein BO70DRAFT_177789 [Aspergillus heteromorphus CBS 117.55]|uniref:Uncharacterized protein n=1 Tax=Aspergillus heteromorphus CBS 117.55 TaxID=1448321 RepID=A0A317WP14_9EURO|nr:uncharacterized protein BO70DRAFT_177789 [Aspergillus heteromorphus CBS 117.55]PWY88229.1 hypothetical protein BO70DRAFT_177789 [Aspergillus heteromorphus CBS 117.55]